MSAVAPRGGWSFWSLSILLHCALVAAAAAFWWWQRNPPVVEQRLAIEATVVMSRAGSRPTPVTEPELPPPPVAPDPAPEEPPDDSDERARVAEAEAERVAEERRLAEERLAAERKATEEAERRKAELAAQEKAEREKAEREKEAREAAEQARRKQEQALAERARAQRERELNAQIAAEERLAAARASGVMAQYIAQITARIERAWIRPPSAAPGLQCEVRVTQVPGGAVTAVQVGRCNGDESVRQSIEAAVYRASPLPLPQDPALFERNLVVTFRPEN